MRKRKNEKKNGDLKAPIKLMELGEAIQRKRSEETLSLRDAAREVGIGASTLWRLERGQGLPDSATLARLTRWLNIPMERFLETTSRAIPKSVVYYPQESTPDIVEAHLRADRNLSPDTAKALAELFRVAYREFTRK